MTTGNPMNPNSGWKVTSQVEVTDIGPTGQFVPGYRVYFTTAAGHNGSVFVPRDQYSPDNVRTIIAAHADQLDAVGKLQS